MDFFQRQRAMFTPQEQDQIEDLVVLIAGAGGLGSHQALELQRCGVKKIYLIDDDQVEGSNLNRQVLYGKGDIGRSKVRQAKQQLSSYQLGTEIIAQQKRVTEELQVPAEVDVIFDALDNFPSRCNLETVANKYQLPLIHAGVNSWYGQVTTIIPGETYSLEEIIGEPELGKGKLPVLSPVVSILASLQVIEGLKVGIGRDNILTNKLLLVDLADYSLERIELE